MGQENLAPNIAEAGRGGCGISLGVYPPPEERNSGITLCKAHVGFRIFRTAASLCERPGPLAREPCNELLSSTGFGDYG